MKAVVCTRYGPPEVLRVEELATPVPRENEVRVHILATAATSIDCYVRGLRAGGRPDRHVRERASTLLGAIVRSRLTVHWPQPVAVVAIVYRPSASSGRLPVDTRC